MTDQIALIENTRVAQTEAPNDYGLFSQPVRQVQLKDAVRSLTGDTVATGQVKSNGDKAASSVSAGTMGGAPTGTWQRIEATTEEGVKNFLPGIKHAVLDHPGSLVENAAISAAIGFAGKVILPETGALASAATLGMGAYFTVSSMIPVVHAYKTGIETGNTHLAGQQLGDAMGGAVASLPVAAGSYWAGARLGGAVMGMDAMAGVAAWKDSKLGPINDKLTNFVSKRPAENAGATTTEITDKTEAQALNPLAALKARFRPETIAAVSKRTTSNFETGKPGFEVVLSASGSETTAHIGFLQALEDKHVPITSVMGASGGSLAAAFYANGYSAAAMKTIFLSPEFRYPSPSVMADCLHVTDPWNLFPYSMDFKPWLQNVIKKYDLKPQPTLRIVAADATTHAPTVFEGTDYDLATALAASTAATPAMNLKPVSYNGQTLIDGFYYHPIPAALAKTPPAIVSKIGFTTKPPSELLSPWDYLLHINEMLGSPENIKKYPDPPGHIIAHTGLPDVAMTTFGLPLETLEQLIDHGYQVTTERLNQPDAVAAIAARTGATAAPDAVAPAKNTNKEQ